MAFRSPSNCLRNWMLLRSGLRVNVNHPAAAYATSTAPRMKAYTTSPSVADLGQAGKSSVNKVVKKHGDFVPVYVALGLIVLSLSFGLHTAKQQLMYSPTVHVRKSRRETLPDVEEPDKTLEEAEKFIKKSFFRKIAHVQELNRDHVISDPSRGDILVRPLKAETLKDVGVDTKLPKAYGSRVWKDVASLREKRGERR